MKYPVDVRLIAPGLKREVTGRSLNVSASGIFVEARELVDIGTEVWCDLPLPGGTRRLAGRVARLQPLPFSSDRVGLGIRFVDLDEGAFALLSNLVNREGAEGHLAEATFEGLPGALRSQAVLTDGGARLSTALPFLRPGAEVQIAFLSGAATVASKGVVRGAGIEGHLPGGAPRLTVEVEFIRNGTFDDPFGAEDEPEDVTAVDTPRALQAASMVAEAKRIATTPIVVPASARPPRPMERSVRRPIEQRGRARRRPAAAVSSEAVAAPMAAAAPRPAMRMGLGVTAALACFALGGISARLWPSSPGTAGEQQAVTATSVAPPVPPPRSDLTGVRSRTEPAPPVAPMQVQPDPQSPPLRRVIARPVADEHSAPASPASPASAPAPPAPAVEAREAGRPRRSASYTEAALRAAQPVPPGTPGPALVREGDELVAVVPFDGSAEGWRQYRLSEPRAVAVNLPAGRPALAMGRHAFANDGFRGVWVREHEHGGIQLRFTLAYRTPEVLGVEVRDGTVRVRVAPAAR